MSQFDTTKDIINLAASECGITAVEDPYVSVDPTFVQLRNLLASCGREMLVLHPWEKLVKEATVTTLLDTQSYDLPADYGYMVDQTGWDRTNDQPLGGPLTPQNWAYLLGSGIGASRVYISFRKMQNKFWISNTSIAAGIDIRFEYISRLWASDAAGAVFNDKPTLKDDIVLYESILMVKFLKLRFLQAKGFDTSAAEDQFSTQFLMWTGHETPGPVLNMAGSRSFPYLGERNIPETNFGV